MKRLIFTLLCLMSIAAIAQPPARRKAEAAEQEKKAATANVPKAAAYRDFPTAQPMPENAAWRRDIYRSLDLKKDENASLNFPTTPQGGRVIRFTYLFKLILRGQIKAYDYKLDGNEDFSADNVVKARELMERYHIFFEEKDGRVRVNDVDLPSDEVLAYYIKESSYYDQYTGSFHTKVTALCPVLKRGDSDFGAETSNPMFWVKYDDVKMHLAAFMVTGSNLNNAAMLSADDFFTMNLYKGDIYYVSNLQDKVLASYCETDSALKKEQQRIEKELTDFKEHVWKGDSLKVEAEADADSLLVEEKATTSRRSTATRTPSRRASAASKSTAASAPKSSASKTSAKTSSKTSSKASKASSKSSKSSKKSKTSKPKRQRTSVKSSPKNSSATFSVRRERH